MGKKLIAYFHYLNEKKVEIPLKNFIFIFDKNGVGYGYLEFPKIFAPNYAWNGDDMMGRDNPPFPSEIVLDDKRITDVFKWQSLYEKKYSGKNSMYYVQAASGLAYTLATFYNHESGDPNTKFRWRKYNDGTHTYYPCGIALDNFALFYGSDYKKTLKQRSFSSSLKQKYDPGSDAICIDYQVGIVSFGAGTPDSAIIHPVFDSDGLYYDIVSEDEIGNYNSTELGFVRVFFENRNTELWSGPEGFYYNYFENRNFYIRNGFPDIFVYPGEKINGETIETIIYRQNSIEIYTEYIPDFSRQQITGNTIEREKRIFPRKPYYLFSWFTDMPSSALAGNNNSDYSYFSFISPAIIRDTTEMRVKKVKARVYGASSSDVFEFTLSEYKKFPTPRWWDIETKTTTGTETIEFFNLEDGAMYRLHASAQGAVSDGCQPQWWIDPECLEVI